MKQFTKDNKEYFAGIPFEEDVEVVQARYAEKLGRNGKYNINGKFKRLFHPYYGVLWYGDIDSSDYAKISELNVEFGFTARTI